MRILHIIPTYLPAYKHGGPIWSVHNLNKWLVKRGIDVMVYTTDIDIPENIPRAEEVNIDGVKVFYFPASFPKQWKYSRELHKQLALNVSNFDLVHITSTFLAASTLGAYYAKKFKKPYIISPRGNLMKEPLEKKSSLKKKLYISFIEERNLTDADAVHFTVKKEKEEYDDTGLTTKKALIIPNGLDFNDFETNISLGGFRKKIGISEDKKIILFLGRISWKKGFDVLIPAFAEVLKKEPNTLLVLAGSDDEGYKKKVEKWVDEHKLKNKVLFTGMILGDDKISALQDSDVFVLPSYSENFGMAVIEAMYFRLPVVITKNVGVAPYIKQDEAGLVVEKNVEEIATAIMRILGNKKFAQEVGEKGREIVKNEFAMPKIAEKWVEAYNSIVKHE